MTPKQRRTYIIVAAVAVVLVVISIVISVVFSNNGGDSNNNQPEASTPSTNQNPTSETEITDNGSDIQQSITYDNIENWSGSIITNYDTVVKNLPQQRKNDASKMLLYTLNDNGVSAIPTDIIIRDGSYNQTTNTNTMTYYTTYIVDIPSIKQSYRITDQYSAIDNYDPTSYATVVTCLDNDELIYGDFNCSDQIKQERGE